MVIRDGLVTNSSSSSFICVKVKSLPFNLLMNKVEKYLDTKDKNVALKCFMDETEIFCEYSYIDIPKQKKEMLDLLQKVVLFISHDVPRDLLVEIETTIKSLKDNNYANLESLVWEETNIGYGEDDMRYDPDEYSQKSLQKVYDEIAELLDCGIDDITEDDFYEYVADKSSCIEKVFTFENDKKRIKFKHEMRIE